MTHTHTHIILSHNFRSKHAVSHKIGASVAKLKKHADDGVSNSAKVLVRKWKRVAEASGVQGSSKSEGSVPSKGNDTAELVHAALNA